MNFQKWLETFLDEKGISQQTELTIENANGNNYLLIETLMEFLNKLPKDQKAKIKSTFVMIDFKNGDTMHFIKHLATGMVNM